MTWWTLARTSLELGVPFSDPMADGPVIQKAGEAALRHGIGMAQVLAMVKQFREKDNRTPVVLMGYANPVERYDGVHGEKAFVDHAKAAGVDGVLVVDYPPEECEEFAADLRARDMDPHFPARAHLHGCAHGVGRTLGDRIRLLRVTQRRHRRRPT